MFEKVIIGTLLLQAVRNNYPDHWEKTLQFDLTLKMKYNKLTFTQKHQADKIIAEYSDIPCTPLECLQALYYFYALNPMLFQSAGVLVERIDRDVVSDFDMAKYKQSFIKIVSTFSETDLLTEPTPRFEPTLLLG
jgi:hypothetical protein